MTSITDSFNWFSALVNNHHCKMDLDNITDKRTSWKYLHIGRSVNTPYVRKCQNFPSFLQIVFFVYVKCDAYSLFIHLSVTFKIFGTVPERKCGKKVRKFVSFRILSNDKTIQSWPKNKLLALPLIWTTVGKTVFSHFTRTIFS